MSESLKKETVGSFLLKVLNGTTIAIVVALIPNAILATFLKPFVANSVFCAELLHIVQVFQFFTPIMAGALIAQQFKLSPMHMVIVGGAAYIGSGAWRFVTNVTIADKTANIFQLAGIGDVINTMITAALAVLVLQLIGNRMGSLSIVFLPIIVGTGVGYVGWKILPFVSQITTLIGHGINAFTTLQPILMSILISMSFAIIIISPISTVAIGLAIGLTGIGSAAAGMGVAACAAFLVCATLRVNKPGVPIAIALGAMKMMMPNFLTTPIIGLGAALTAAISSLSIPLLGMGGTPGSAGFGLVGFVSPLAALNSSNVGILVIVLTWVVVPFVVGFIIDRLFVDVLHLYKNDIFKSKAN